MSSCDRSEKCESLRRRGRLSESGGKVIKLKDHARGGGGLVNNLFVFRSPPGDNTLLCPLSVSRELCVQAVA